MTEAEFTSTCINLVNLKWLLVYIKTMVYSTFMCAPVYRIHNSGYLETILLLVTSCWFMPGNVILSELDLMSIRNLRSDDLWKLQYVEIPKQTLCSVLPQNIKRPRCLEDWPRRWHQSHQVQNHRSKDVGEYINTNRKWKQLNLEYTHAKQSDDRKLYKHLIKKREWQNPLYVLRFKLFNVWQKRPETRFLWICWH